MDKNTEDHLPLRRFTAYRRMLVHDIRRVDQGDCLNLETPDEVHS